METMSAMLVVQILFLITFSVVATALLTYYTLIHFTKWATKYQMEQVAAMLEEDEEPGDPDYDYGNVSPMYPR